MNFGWAGTVTCGSHMAGKGDERCWILPPLSFHPLGGEGNENVNKERDCEKKWDLTQSLGAGRLNFYIL